MKGTSVNFLISEPLTQKIDKAMEAWGFATRAEFFRYCAIEFLRFDAQAMPPDHALQGYTNAVRSVKASKELARRGWRF